MIVAEVGFRCVAVQMGGRTVLIHTDHVPLEDGVITFDGGRTGIASAIFALAVTDKIVLSEVLAEVDILTGFVLPHAAFRVNEVADNRKQISRLVSSA